MQRSKAFRQLLSQEFTPFLELCLGFRPENPLPGPPARAAALRATALEVVERWSEDYGVKHRQVRLYSIQQVFTYLCAWTTVCPGLRNYDVHCAYFLCPELGMAGVLHLPCLAFLCNCLQCTATVQVVGLWSETRAIAGPACSLRWAIAT